MTTTYEARLREALREIASYAEDNKVLYPVTVRAILRGHEVDTLAQPEQGTALADPMTKLDDIIKEWREREFRTLADGTKFIRCHESHTANNRCADQLESYAASERQFRAGLEALRNKWRNASGANCNSPALSSEYWTKQKCADELTALLADRDSGTTK